MERRNYVLDAIRILSFIWILLFHAKIHYGFSIGFGPINTMVNLGACGCSIFFVLSGFLLRRKYNGGGLIREGRLRQYYLCRLKAIFPLYYLFLVISFLSGYRFPNSIKKTLLLIPAELLLTQTWFSDNTFGYFFNDNFWFLSVLLFLYIVFPYLSELQDMLKNEHRRILTACIMLGSVYLFSTCIILDDSFQNYYTNPLLRLPEFSFGMLVADSVVSSEENKKKNRAGLMIASVIAMLVLMERVGWPLFRGEYNLYNLFIFPFFYYILKYSETIDVTYKHLNKALPVVAKFGMSIYLSQSISIMLIDEYDIKISVPWLDFIVITILIAGVVQIVTNKGMEIIDRFNSNRINEE